MTILLTGGAGYIGSHTAVELLEAGHEVVLADDFENSSGEDVLTFESPKAFSCIVFTSSELSSNETYTIYSGGSHTGTASDGIYSGGSYSSGTKLGDYSF